MAWWKNASDLFNMEKAAELVEKAKSAAKDAAETVQAEYRRTFEELDCKIVHVRPNLAVMEFPSDDTIARLSTRLNSESCNKLLIYNMSGATYNASLFEGEVRDVAMFGDRLLSFEKTVQLCLEVYQCLGADDRNMFVVHGEQGGYGMSATFMSCLLVFGGYHSGAAAALEEVCRLLDIDEQAAVIASQRRFLQYFQQWHQGATPAQVPLKFTGMKLTTAPSFEHDGTVGFRPQIEVRCADQALFETPAGECREVTPTEWGASIPLDAAPVVTGNTMVSVHHVSPDGRRVLAFSFAFHSAFVSEGLSLRKVDLDQVCNDRFADDMVLDVVLETASAEEASEETPSAASAEVFEKARAMSKSLEEEARERAAAQQGGDDETKKAAAAASDAVPTSSSTEGTGSVAAKPASALDDMDELFGQFDAALNAISAGSVTSNPAEAGAVTSNPAEAGADTSNPAEAAAVTSNPAEAGAVTSNSAEAEGTAVPSGDALGEETDAFLKELEAC